MIQAYQTDINTNFTIGKACFDTQLLQIRFQYIAHKLKDDYWKINFYQYYSEKWVVLFQHMTQCLARQLFIQKKTILSKFILNSNIIKQISHIKFQNLRLLQLRENNITNIQDVCTLLCPILTDLYLGKNFISRVKSLNKFPYFKISELQLNLNPISQISQLHRFRFNYEYYYSNFQIDGYLYSHNQSNYVHGPLSSDIGKILRFNYRNLKNFSINYKGFRNNRIDQQKVRNMMTKKFPGMYFTQHN